MESTCNSSHAPECSYTDEDMLAYADLKVDGHRITFSAIEVGLLHDLIESGLNKDSDVHINTDAGDDFPYGIIYGGIMVSKSLLSEVKNTDELIEELNNDFIANEGCILASIDRNFKNMVTDVFHGAYIDQDKSSWKADNYLPVAALIQTNKQINNMASPTTFFPLEKSLLVECLLNRPYLFAARSFTPLDNTAINSWKQHINTDELYEAYKIADLVLE